MLGGWIGPAYPTVREALRGSGGRVLSASPRTHTPEPRGGERGRARWPLSPGAQPNLVERGA
eukprot:4806819-Pleurochrysis_carterae.AAC.1